MKRVRLSRVLSIIIPIALIIFFVQSPSEEVRMVSEQVEHITGDITQSPLIRSYVQIIEQREDPTVTFIGGDIHEPLTIQHNYSDAITYLRDPTGSWYTGTTHNLRGPGKYIIRINVNNTVVHTETLWLREILHTWKENKFTNQVNQLNVVTTAPVERVEIRGGEQVAVLETGEAENYYSYILDVGTRSGVLDFYGWNGWLFSKKIEYDAPNVSVVGQIVHKPVRIRLTNQSDVRIEIENGTHTFTNLGLVYGPSYVETIFVPQSVGQYRAIIYKDTVKANRSFWVNEKMSVNLTVLGLDVTVTLNSPLSGGYDATISDGNRSRSSEVWLTPGTKEFQMRVSTWPIQKFSLKSNSSQYYYEEWLRR